MPAVAVDLFTFMAQRFAAAFGPVPHSWKAETEELAYIWQECVLQMLFPGLLLPIRDYPARELG